MWRRSIAALAATAMVVTIVAGAPVARAGGPSEPFLGDLNGDSVLDRARLDGTRRACAVVVEFGRPGGGYLPPQRHPYQLPGGTRSADCPQLGVAVDLDPASPTTPGPAELVVGWYDGPPSRPDYDLLVLRNFTVSARVPAIDRPNYMGLADFDGDRRPDVYLWTDQGQGFATYLNPGTGTLTPGPVRFCAGRVQYRLADFDRDRAMDVAIAYAEHCGDGSDGVAVVLDDGTVVRLQQSYDDRQSWTVDTLNANRDGNPDLLLYRQPIGRIWTFLGTGNGSFVSSPLAIGDTATVTVTGSVRIPVLGNDWASRRASISVVVPPATGSTEVTSSRMIVYRPAATVGATDRFVYRITQDGRTSDATVLVRIVPRPVFPTKVNPAFLPSSSPTKHRVRLRSNQAISECVRPTLL
ncbi:FG-GAP-like repeat-containing protein [Plantactinospora veratri]|uniref:FG-GAP-like repeat-containing protein n=1 Tax=Plantactinospora veratri TaxID=1436122 RepID=A0ABU7S821_9ACTN